MGVEIVEPAVVAEMLRNGRSFVLLDCREPEEVQAASIRGAVHIPVGDIPTRLPSLDPDAPTVVVCHHGVRSQKVAQWLERQGFTNVGSLRGGIDAWAREVDPAVARY